MRMRWRPHRRQRAKAAHSRERYRMDPSQRARYEAGRAMEQYAAGMRHV